MGGLAGRIREYVRLNGAGYTARRAVEKFRDQVLGEYTNNNLGGEMKECTYSLGDDYYVIGCAKGNTALRDLLNDTIEKLVSDGTAAQISEKWFGRDIVVFEPLEEE